MCFNCTLSVGAAWKQAFLVRSCIFLRHSPCFLSSRLLLTLGLGLSDFLIFCFAIITSSGSALLGCKIPFSAIFRPSWCVSLSFSSLMSGLGWYSSLASSLILVFRWGWILGNVLMVPIYIQYSWFRKF